MMMRGDEVSRGDVISFRVPETIPEVDLAHMRNDIAHRPTVGRQGPWSAFFFAKVSEERALDGPHVVMPLPQLTQEQQRSVADPVFLRAMSMYAQQLLGMASTTGTATPNAETSATNTQPAPEAETGKKTKPANTGAVDKRALDLANKLRGGE